jgi:hypothetical protein
VRGTTSSDDLPALPGASYEPVLKARFCCARRQRRSIASEAKRHTHVDARLLGAATALEVVGVRAHAAGTVVAALRRRDDVAALAAGGDRGAGEALDAAVVDARVLGKRRLRVRRLVVQRRGLAWEVSAVRRRGGVPQQAHILLNDLLVALSLVLGGHDGSGLVVGEGVDVRGVVVERQAGRARTSS